ncbi:MAG: hypothetical protein K2X27_07265 [Candidatus Obscuribacterales bacterium]|nr:hypothetical protein [Candidatus Obscuribacterales bacterium]
MAIFSFADASFDAAAVPAIESAAQQAGFTLLPASEIPEKIACRYGALRLYSGQVPYDGEARLCYLCLGEAGEIVLALQIPQAAIGPRRKRATEAIRSVFGVSPEDIESAESNLDALDNLVFSLARKVRGE